MSLQELELRMYFAQSEQDIQPAIPMNILQWDERMVIA